MRLGRQLFSVARGGLYDLGAGLTTGGVDNRDRVAVLVIAHAPSVRPFLPVGAQRVTLDLPFAMHHGSRRRLVEARAILGPIDHDLTSYPRLPTPR